MAELKIVQDAPPERMFSVRELAVLWKLSETAIRDHIDAGALGYVNVGRGAVNRTLRIPASEARRFMDSHFVPARLSA